ncbi:hypothetical protein ABZ532_16150 [Streptomyces sp. NPDC019396]|uniref:hypothetical protein n=1 Tax=Streptomyces sp. NPDC019396 TaxID=3154687 RepID=UPI0033FEA49C
MTHSPRSPRPPLFLLFLLSVLVCASAVLLTPGPAAADTGGLAAPRARTERLWLLGGVAVTLTAAGVIAMVATRGNRRRDP